MTDLTQLAAERLAAEMYQMCGDCRTGECDHNSYDQCQGSREALASSAFQAQAKEWEAERADLKRYLCEQDMAKDAKVAQVRRERDAALASKDRAATALAEALEHALTWLHAHDNERFPACGVEFPVTIDLIEDVLAAWAEHLKGQQG